MITVNLCGGIGNTLFQYAFARTLPNSQLFNACNQYGCHLSQFNIKLPFTTRQEGRWISERSLRFDPNPEIVDPSVLSGYWQCEKYFTNIKKELKSEIYVTNSLSYNAEKCSEQMGPGSVMLHIRRGDYLTWARERHGVLPLSYYLEAATFIATRVENPHFFVFSDDQTWAHSLTLPYKTTVVAHSPHEDLWLMGKCQHAVIANSSFSWWGAWLGPDINGGIVIAPKQWFAQGNEDAADIVPQRWTKIDSGGPSEEGFDNRNNGPRRKLSERIALGKRI